MTTNFDADEVVVVVVATRWEILAWVESKSQKSEEYFPHCAGRRCDHLLSFCHRSIYFVTLSRKEFFKFGSEILIEKFEYSCSCTSAHFCVFAKNNLKSNSVEWIWKFTEWKLFLSPRGVGENMLVRFYNFIQCCGRRVGVKIRTCIRNSTVKKKIKKIQKYVNSFSHSKNKEVFFSNHVNRIVVFIQHVQSLNLLLLDLLRWLRFFSVLFFQCCETLKVSTDSERISNFTWIQHTRMRDDTPRERYN